MLSVDKFKDQLEQTVKQLSVRNKDFSSLLQKAVDAENNRKQIKTKYDKLATVANQSAKIIGELYKSGKPKEAEAAKQKASEQKAELKELAEQLKQSQDDLRDILLEIPNIPNKLVPAGKTDQDNQLIRQSEQPEKLSNPVPHWELAKKFDIIDFEAGNKISGAGFPVFKGKGAQLQRALINFFLAEASKAGYTEYVPPLMVNEASGLGTGQLPDKEGQMYEMKNDKLYMIPTAEVPLTNLYRDTIVAEKDLPIKLCGYSPCFRREAGSYGKDVRGLNRLHQFDKVEIVQVTSPNSSYDTLDKMVEHVENLVKSLELPYRIVRLCGGDLGFTSAMTYDFEVMAMGQDKWLEVSSVSNFEDFQSNRLKLRCKTSDKQTVMPHTLNGSALALPRIMASILENNFDGKVIHIPQVLHKYTGFTVID